MSKKGLLLLKEFCNNDKAITRIMEVEETSVVFIIIRSLIPSVAVGLHSMQFENF